MNSDKIRTISHRALIDRVPHGNLTASFLRPEEIRRTMIRAIVKADPEAILNLSKDILDEWADGSLRILGYDLRRRNIWEGSTQLEKRQWFWVSQRAQRKNFKLYRESEWKPVRFQNLYAWTSSPIVPDGNDVAYHLFIHDIAAVFSRQQTSGLRYSNPEVARSRDPWLWEDALKPRNWERFGNGGLGHMISQKGLAEGLTYKAGDNPVWFAWEASRK